MSEIAQWKIPNNWKWAQIYELGKVVSGGTPSTKEPTYWGNDINWISPADLSGYNSKFISKGAKSLSKKGLEKSSAKLMPRGSIHFSSRAPIGYVVISKEEISTNQGFKSIVPSDKIFNEYVYYYLKNSKQLAERYASGTTFKEISGKAFSLLPIPIAPYNEQHCIVTKVEQLFSDLDNGIDNFKKAQEQLKRYRQSVLKAACEGRLVPTEAELACAEGRDYEPADVLLARILKERREKWNGKGKYKEPAVPDMGGLQELPDGWVWNKLWLCSNLITKGESPKWQGFEYIEEGIPFIRSENVLWGDVNLLKAVKIPEEFHNKLRRSQLKPFDVLINLVGASIGRCGVVPSTIISANINQAVSLIRVNNALLPSYLVQLLLSPQLQKNIHAGKVDTARPNISLGDLRQLLIPLPPLAEQHRIVTEVEHRISHCDKLEATITESLEKAEALRQSILKKAFEGKLLNAKELEEACNAPDWEPAEKLLERIKAEKTNIVKNKGKK